MPRTLENVLRVTGPFLGVNESVAGDIQPPQYAETMKNIVLNRGQIEARPGLRNVLTIEDAVTVPWINAIATLPFAFRDGGDGPYASNARVLVVTSEQSPSPNSTLYLTKAFARSVIPYRTVGKLPALSREARGDIVHLADKSFIAFGDWDRPRVVKWEPNALKDPSRLPNTVDVNRAGFDLITEAHTLTTPEPSGDQVEFPPGRYAFALTLYDADNGTESNGDYKYGSPSPSRFTDVVANTILRFEVFFPNASPDPNTARITHIRLYAIVERLDEDPDGVESGGETGYRLIAEIPVDPAQGVGFVVVEIGRAEVRIVPIVSGAQALSFQGIGPYIPTRNDPPPKSNAIAVFDNKVCYASIDPDSYGALFYSADFNGEHVAADAFIAFDDEGSEPITGLAVYQGRLLVFKETAIYVIAGNLTQHTNDTIALGQPAPQPLFQKHRVQADTGCFNKGGSLALKECDGVLYYSALDGVYGFDGLRARKVSDPINKTHALVPEASRDKCTMANDRQTGVLWIHYTQEGDKVFCFDYRKGVGDPSVGNWTIHHFPLAVSLIADVPSAVCPVLSSDPLVLAGTGDEPARLLEMLAAQRGKDHTIAGNDRYFQWLYETPWMSLGLLDRSKRIHTVTLFYGPGATERFYLSVRVEQSRVHGYFNPEIGRSVASRFFPLISPEGKPTGKFAINKRGTRIKLVLSASVTEKCIGPFTGFAIDAEPIGRR